MAEIHVLTGPMFSGKTSKMLERIHKYSNVTKQQVLLISFSGDDRCKDSDHGITTHVYGDSTQKIPIGKYIKSIRVNNLLDIPIEFVRTFYMIGIDEAQFYPDLYDFTMRHLKDDMVIHVSGLAYDSNNKKFGQIMDLHPFALTSRKLSAICCRHDPKIMRQACITQSLVKKDIVVAIGGLDSYESICLRCYFE